nr:MAG TPA: hypothetical protein [Caudoviricetes sp.]
MWAAEVDGRTPVATERRTTRALRFRWQTMRNMNSSGYKTTSAT